ncbi:MAG: type IV toxin-antitoxin system AbiEi family antitoxin domain-containing protein [Acidimicrobiia bacterium]
MKDQERLLVSTARSQRGVFTLAQAKACGIPRRTISGRVSRGVYETLHPGVFGLAGSEDSWHRRVLASVLSISEPASASHKTAAYLWGMTSQRPEVTEVVVRRYRRRDRPPFTVHESKDIRESDIVQVDGIPVTMAARTVVDLGASAPPRFVEKCLDTGLRKRLLTVWEVSNFIARVARPGRTGVGTIRPLIEERLTWAGLTASDLEDLFRRVVASTPYPMPDPQFTLLEPNGDFVGRYDFAYPSRMALIETDSEGYHMDPVSFQRDREKQNRAQMLGWTVYRFTWRQLVDDPGAVIEVIASIWED